ncbi:protein phosphatase 1 regulatory subunit 14D isoform X4 [Callorhinus ursinus]|uniref:Protein phosphatase 1 regulatory subunit 14 n=1 Tax=Zalophus californianus TaxID=9704 RepID=A0A6J2B0E4_ZALCA|nr:protein phosphatase 1 regulatory subunit 14D isoform X4 [Zalophus californianus]
MVLAHTKPSMLSSSPTSCTSPNPDGENPSKKVHWTSGRSRTSSTDSESKSHADPSKASRSRRPSRLTVKYDRGQLQRWLEMEQWVDAQVQELFQAILRNCPRPTEPFISELLSQLKKLRRLSRPQK